MRPGGRIATFKARPASHRADGPAISASMPTTTATLPFGAIRV
jgi:hypothetical protein